jgi:hypothetical protein
MQMTFDSLRTRRRALVRLLLPILLLNWVGAAALPCAAMGTVTEAVDGTEIPASVVDMSHHAGHAVHGEADAGSHRACPHCAHGPDGSVSGGAAAHASCGGAPVNLSNDSYRPSAKQDLGSAVPVIPQPIAAARPASRFAKFDPNGIPPPTQALYLKHCVFLN